MELSQFFGTGNPFMTQYGMGQMDTQKQKQEADLATILGMEQRNAAMHPLEMQNKQAVTDLNKSTAAMNQYALATKLPKEEALKQNMQKFFKESDEMTQEQTRMQVQRMYQLAQMAKANGGALPPGVNVPPEEMDRYSLANLDRTIKYGEAFFASDPKEIAARQRAAEALKLAQTRTDGQIAVKETPTPGKGGAGPNTVPQSYAEILAGMSKLKEARQKLAYLKSALPALPEALQVQLQPAYAAIKKQADAEANARLAGQVDIEATTKGKVPVTPPVNLGDAPAAVTGRTARQEATQAPKYTQSDLEFTAKKYNMTVEQVKKQLGIK